MASFASEALGNFVFGHATKAQLMFIPCIKMKCKKDAETIEVYGISGNDGEDSELWNVMINPNSIYESYGIGYTSRRGVDDSQIKIDKSSSPGSRTMSMDLIFDLVDTYDLAFNKSSSTGVINSAMSLFTGSGKKGYSDKVNEYRSTHDGKLPRQFAGYQWGHKAEKIDLNDPDLSCLPKLKAAASDVGSITLVKFRWGRFNITGLVNDLSIRYTYFSYQGQALRAETSLRIMQVPVVQAEAYENHAASTTVEDRSSNEDTTLLEEENTETYD